MSYCTLAELKRYINISSATSAEDDLLQQMLDESAARIDSFCGRKFSALADTTRYFDPLENVQNGTLYFDNDLAYLTSVTDGSGIDITTSVVTQPRNDAPFYAVKIKDDSGHYWTYATDHENAITAAGRWAYMFKSTITALSRDSNVVTATVPNEVMLGSTACVVGCADTSFNGTFTVTAANGATLTWAQTGTNNTDTTAYLLYTPTDIVKCNRRLAAWLYRQKDTQQGDNDRPILAGDGSVIMPSTLPQDVTDILKIYQRVVWS
jgi:hypothetical protein